LKPFLIAIALITFSLHCHAQKFTLHLTGSSVMENKIIDSVSYTPNHQNLKSLHTEIDIVSQKLTQLGYIENRVKQRLRSNDSTYSGQFNLGSKMSFVHMYVGKNKSITQLLSVNVIHDSIFIPYSKVINFLKENTIALERKGYSLARLKLTNIKRKGNTLFTQLEFESEKQRRLNAIIIKQTDNQQQNTFPAGPLAQIKRKYTNQTFNQEIVSKINSEFENFRFVNQIKYPEILFTKDSTKVYVYLEKRNSNTFDGFIGFSTNENKKITFNGYLDLTLENSLNVGEQFSLYWKTDGNKQRTFKTALELPYLFKTPIGLKAQLNIFKQDSTFQNTKTEIDISYFVKHNTRIYVGYQSTVSSDIQNKNDSVISDYNNSFITANLAYSKQDDPSTLFFTQSSLLLKTGLGNRQTNNPTENSNKATQFFLELQASHTFYLNTKNSIAVRTQNYYLHSPTYLSNELIRFGGINSVRGFAENSLQGHFLSSLLTEYRYQVSPTLYVHSILDYAIFQDNTALNTNDFTKKVLGLGAGLGLQTKTGLLKLAFTKGNAAKQKINFNNTILQLTYNIKF
jgi:hypothetical protein